VKARQEAERVLAPSRAPRTFALAQEKESEAEAALGRQDAASARVQFQKEQARDRMTVARRTAEQAGPSQRGTSLLASGKAKNGRPARHLPDLILGQPRNRSGLLSPPIRPPRRKPRRRSLRHSSRSRH